MSHSEIDPRRWGWAIGGSVLAHLVLLAFVLQQSHLAKVPPSGPAALLATAELAGEPVFIDVSMVDGPTVPLAIPPPEDSTPDLHDAREADRDRDVAETVAPRVAADPRATRPAPDHGIDGGQRLARAWRRDTGSLQQRVTDGASAFQPAHQRTSRQATSPQAVRREPTVGIGDAVATQVPARLPALAQHASPEEGVEPDGTGQQDGTRQGAVTEVETVLVAETPVADRGQGPLDVERGTRMFDNDRRGPIRDDQSVRNASAATQTGIVDFSRAAATAPIDAPQGRGPATSAGAVARPSSGVAANEQGAANPQKLGEEVSERTQDRHYDRYFQEISMLVSRQRVFPRSLALRLEQGETIVYFVVRTDGKLSDGVRVVKSSGFDEFDNEAIRAVLRAAPFPPMPNAATARPRPVSMRVLFDNQVVR
jgi:TonB family protein